ncbi:MAG: peptide/nickel transport system substrate-binding protein [Anaerolineaceae bacterium]|nr:MAG: peptide/nickel transport system substrate-binding protein [Anaerolineaceae bacterium]
MKKLRWQVLVVVLTLAVVGILLVTQRSSPTGTALPQPATGGIYTEALVGSFGRLNPALDWANPADRAIDRLIFSGMIKFDEYGIPRSDVAESWGVSQDGMIYNVSLRQDAFWEDGMPVTSDDVIFTLGLLRSQYSTYPADARAMWDEILVKRLDEKTLQFVLPEPFAPFLDYLSFGILPKHVLETLPADQLANSDFNLKPVGCGPFRVDHLTVENGQVTGVTLALSENYFGGRPYIEQITFRYYPTAAAALDAYQQGDMLGISEITPDILAEACSDPNLNCYTSRMPRLTLVLFNHKSNDAPFLQDKNIRKALLLGLNRQRMIDVTLNGQAVVADSPILPGTWAYYSGIQHVEYDPIAAERLLAEAGYILPAGETVRVKDGAPLAFTLLHPDDDQHTRVAQWIQQDWAAIGVQVTLRAMPYASLVNDSLAPRAYQAALVDLDLSGSPDPDPYPFWHQSEATGGQNYSQWDNRPASEYLEQARVVFDQSTRARLYRNFQVIFAKETPAVLLYHPVYTYGVDVRVNGVQLAPIFDPSDRFDTILDWYLLTRRAAGETAQPTISP